MCFFYVFCVVFLGQMCFFSSENSVYQVFFEHFLLFYSKFKNAESTDLSKPCLPQQFLSRIEESVLNLYYFIAKSPARRTDIFEIDKALGVNELILQHHVQSHWLSPMSSIQYVMSMTAALVKLFMD